jgi:hypothetical protein
MNMQQELVKPVYESSLSQEWKEKFMIKASIRGYDTIITGEDKAPNTHNPNNGRKLLLKEDEQVISDQNKKGYGDLILSIECSNLKERLHSPSSKMLRKNGFQVVICLLAFNKLKTKYEPKTTPQLMQLTKEFHSKALIKYQDPEVFIAKLETLQIKLEDHGHHISEQTMVIHILNNLDQTYDMEVKLLEHRIHQMKE